MRVSRAPVALLLVGSCAAIVLAGCGEGSHFKNRARPPVTLELTGAETGIGRARSILDDMAARVRGLLEQIDELVTASETDAPE